MQLCLPPGTISRETWRLTLRHKETDQPLRQPLRVQPNEEESCFCLPGIYL